MTPAVGNDSGRPQAEGSAARRAPQSRGREPFGPKYWITDARGRRVRQLDPYELWLRRRTDLIPAEELRAIAREIGFGLARSQRILFGVGLVCALIVVASVFERVVVMLLNGTFSVGGLVQASRVLLAVAPAPFIFWMGARLARHGRTTRVMLAHRRCPHCGYDLRGLPVQPDDEGTRCPECGCVWKLGAECGVDAVERAGPPP